MFNAEDVSEDIATMMGEVREQMDRLKGRSLQDDPEGIGAACDTLSTQMTDCLQTAASYLDEGWFSKTAQGKWDSKLHDLSIEVQKLLAETQLALLPPALV